MRRTYKKKNITFVEVSQKKEGNQTAFNLLKELTDGKTALFLSAEETLTSLYKIITQDKQKQIKPAAAAGINEKWGFPGHEKSKEKQFQDLGLYKYFVDSRSEVYTILHGILTKKETIERHNVILQGLMERLENKIGILGVNGIKQLIMPKAEKRKDEKKLIVEGPCQKIIPSPEFLRRLDIIIALIYGEKGKKIIKKLSQKTNLNKIFLITDQKTT